MAFQFVGLSASAFLVFVTVFHSDQVEAKLQSFAITKVEAAANAAWIQTSDALHTGNRAERLAALAHKFGVQADTLDQNREEIIPALVAFSLSDRCADACGLAAASAHVVKYTMLEKAAALRVGESTLGDFIVERYETTVQGLMLDLRRFGLVNVVTLALMCALILFKDVLNWRFTMLSVAVTGYATWAAYGYLFKQDWARTVLTQNWAADGYQAMMILVSCMFFDWLFLRARVTQTVLNGISAVIPG